MGIGDPRPGMVNVPQRRASCGFVERPNLQRCQVCLSGHAREPCVATRHREPARGAADQLPDLLFGTQPGLRGDDPVDRGSVDFPLLGRYNTATPASQRLVDGVADVDLEYATPGAAATSRVFAERHEILQGRARGGRMRGRGAGEYPGCSTGRNGDCRDNNRPPANSPCHSPFQ